MWAGAGAGLVGGVWDVRGQEECGVLDDDGEAGRRRSELGRRARQEWAWARLVVTRAMKTVCA